MEHGIESLPPEIFELPGEPAIVINGVPDVPSSNNAGVPKECPKDGTLTQNNNVKDSDLGGNAGFGVWLEGRDVRKLFGNQYYSGTVTNFDKESGWYRVVYEDGDFEDLDWHELQAVLLPLDITVPVKSLALKITKNNQKPTYKSGKNLAQYSSGLARGSRSTGKKVAAHKKFSAAK